MIYILIVLIVCRSSVYEMKALLAARRWCKRWGFNVLLWLVNNVHNRRLFLPPHQIKTRLFFYQIFSTMFRTSSFKPPSKVKYFLYDSSLRKIGVFITSSYAVLFSYLRSLYRTLVTPLWHQNLNALVLLSLTVSNPDKPIYVHPKSSRRLKALCCCYVLCSMFPIVRMFPFRNNIP